MKENGHFAHGAHQAKRLVQKGRKARRKTR